jgi:hypothetical protein
MRRRRVRTICERQHRFMRSCALTLLMILLYACQAQADTQTWNVTASCQLGDSVQGFPCAAPSVISAVFTTQLETKLFEDTSNLFPFTGTEPVVVDISGTFDGMSMTLIPPPGGGGWICAGCGNIPEGIEFTAGGNPYSLWWDGYTFLTLSGSPTTVEVMNWRAVDPMSIPEPSELILGLIGVDLVLVWGWMRRRNAKV